MKPLAAFCLLLAGCSRELSIPATGEFRLPSGIVEIHHGIELPEGAHDLAVIGDRTTLLAAADFRGRAVFAARAAIRLRFRDFTIDGNRVRIEVRQGLPDSATPFRAFTVNSGILVESGEDVTISNVAFRQIAGFAILASAVKRVRVEKVTVDDSGSRNAAGKNNTTGGILFEEGATDFQATNCSLRRVSGNGIWTHSLYTSPRNSNGLLSKNYFEEIARDAIQVGHASRVRVEGNTGSRIGYPESLVDAIPVAIDTAGNVDQSSYSGNAFSDINGKCIDLDGFHDGVVSGNRCVDQRNFGIVMNNTNPDMRPAGVTIEGNRIEGGQYGGIFVIGGPNRILRNRLLRLNLSHSTEGLLRTGIYLGRGAERPAIAHGNIVAGNEISGFGMKASCIDADPKVALRDNTIGTNTCADRLP